MRRLLGPLLAFTVLAGVIAAVAVGCGAQNLPGPARAQQPQRCESLPELAPALMGALEGARAENLRILIERNKLFDPQPDGNPSPVTTLLRVILRTLGEIARDPPEPGAPEGQLCNNTAPPPPRDANRMCETRRVLQTFVHEGKGTEAIRILDPLIAGALNYIVGRPPSATEPHYGVAGAISQVCSREYCSTEDALDTALGLMSYLEPTAEEPRRPKRLLAQVNAVLQDPAMDEMMDKMNDPLVFGPEAMVAFGNEILTGNLMVLPEDHDAFVLKYHRDIEVKINDLLTTTLGMDRQDPKYAALRTAIDALLGPHELPDLEQPHGASRPVLLDLLDPARPGAILLPMQDLLHCAQISDPNSDLLRMVFAISYGEGLVKPKDLLKILEDLVDVDERLSILTLSKILISMIRDDRDGVAAARQLCATALDTSLPPGGGKSNAELVVPVAADLFRDGAIGELVCVGDHLLFGCAEGQQRPACPAP